MGVTDGRGSGGRPPVLPGTVGQTIRAVLGEGVPARPSGSALYVATSVSLGGSVLSCPWPLRAWCGRVVGETLAKPWRPGSFGTSTCPLGDPAARPDRVRAQAARSSAAFPDARDGCSSPTSSPTASAPARASELIDLLWPEDPPAAADSALSALLSKLRRALGDGVLTGRGELRLGLGAPVGVDVEAAEAAIARGEAAIDAAGRGRPPRRARTALAVDLPRFLPDCAGLWVAERRASARACGCGRWRSWPRRASARGAASSAGRAGGEAAIAAAPFRESAHRALMEVHEAAGNPAEALRAFEELRVLLRDELGTTPGPAAMAVHQRLLRGRAGAAAACRRRCRCRPGRAPLAPPTERHGLSAAAGARRSWPAAGARRWAAPASFVLLVGRGRDRQDARRRGVRAPRPRGGALVLYGRFDEETAAPYQPVVEMVRGWSAGASLEPLRERARRAGGELGILLPEFGAPPSRPLAARRWCGRRRSAAAVLRRGRRAAGRGRGQRPRRARVRRPAVGGPADAAAAPPPRALAAAAPDAVPRHLSRRGARRPSTRRASSWATCAGRGRSSDWSSRASARSRSASWSPRSACARRRPASCSALHGETEGNPFFIEEVVGHLRHAGERPARRRSRRRACPRACAR